jgi:tRNA (guanine37-N1)-methyltransferase
VNKLDSINNEFRFFSMELLAGDADFVTEVRENGFRYRLDFSKASLDF